MMQSDVSGAQLSCSEFCACLASQCENQWTVRESSDEEDDGSSHSDSDSDIDFSEEYDKDISVQYRRCGDIIYLFLLVFLSYEYFTNFQISGEIYICSIWFVYVSESALNYLSNDISYTYKSFDKTYFCCQLAAIMVFSQNLRMLKGDKVALH